MRVDAHQHVWNLEKLPYRWLTPDMGPLHRTFTQEEVEPLRNDAGIDAVVLVQADNTFEDTDAMLEVAAEYPAVRGIVAWVPLLDPQASAAALDRYEQEPLIGGIRHLIHTEPDPDWVVQDAVVESLRLLAERDLAFDVVAVLPRHLEHVATLAERVPDLRIVIDHLAKPPIAEKGWEPWASLLATAGEHENVTAKVSGLNTAADPETWTAADLKPYVDHALGCFGADRLMFGSDWPVATLAGSYEKVWKATVELAGDLSAEEQADILGRTAVRVYGLEL